MAFDRFFDQMPFDQTTVLDFDQLLLDQLTI